MSNAIEIDSDLFESLSERAKLLGIPVNRMVDSILRANVSVPKTEEPPPAGRFPAFSMGNPINDKINLDKALALSFSLDLDEYEAL